MRTLVPTSCGDVNCNTARISVWRERGDCGQVQAVRPDDDRKPAVHLDDPVVRVINLDRSGGAPESVLPTENRSEVRRRRRLASLDPGDRDNSHREDSNQKEQWQEMRGGTELSRHGRIPRWERKTPRDELPRKSGCASRGGRWQTAGCKDVGRWLTGTLYERRNTCVNFAMALF